MTHSAIILHGIGTPARPLEPGEDFFWLSRERFCATLDRIAALGAAAPLITFDDGNASDLEIALPELERRGLRGLFFLLSGRLGQPGSLREADVTALARAGHRIGLHGADHVDWRRLDAAGRAREWGWAREKLAALSGQPVDEVAAPFGFYDRQVMQDLKALGFAALHTSDWGPMDPEAFIVPRNCLDHEMDDRALDHALRGHLPPLRALRRHVGIARKRLLPLRLRP